MEQNNYDPIGSHFLPSDQKNFNSINQNKKYIYMWGDGKVKREDLR